MISLGVDNGDLVVHAFMRFFAHYAFDFKPTFKTKFENVRLMWGCLV
jgi:hypothetical protein